MDDAQILFHQAFREWKAVVPVTITATSKNSVMAYLTHGCEGAASLRLLSIRFGHLSPPSQLFRCTAVTFATKSPVMLAIGEQAVRPCPIRMVLYARRSSCACGRNDRMGLTCDELLLSDARAEIIQYKYANCRRKVLLSRPWSIVPIRADTVVFWRSAISCNPSQNRSSRDTLDLCPSRMIERFMTGDFIMFITPGFVVICDDASNIHVTRQVRFP